MALATRILAIDLGSSSKKYALGDGATNVLEAHFEKNDKDISVRIESSRRSYEYFLHPEEYYNATQFLIKWAKENINLEPSTIRAVGLRIVAPGTFFLDHKIIDEEYIIHLQTAQLEAPLHITPILEEIGTLQKNLPNIPVIGISDSAFHKTMEESARHYAIPSEVAERFDIYRFGYHGLSTQSVLRKANHFLIEKLPEKVIVCHLGSGASITAVRNGHSIDTSMGYSPLEGLPMNTRVGDIDVGAVVTLAKNMRFNYSDLEKYLNYQAGLKGISGTTGSVKDLLVMEKKGDDSAKLALSIFVSKIKKYIGSYIALLGGIDALIFTGTIGERSWILRERICRNMEFANIILDEEINKNKYENDALISSTRSIPILVMNTEELKEITYQVKLIIDK